MFIHMFKESALHRSFFYNLSSVIFPSQHNLMYYSEATEDLDVLV